MHCELYNGKDFEKKTQKIHEIKKTKTERKEQTEIWKKNLLLSKNNCSWMK